MLKNENTFAIFVIQRIGRENILQQRGNVCTAFNVLVIWKQLYVKFHGNGTRLRKTSHCDKTP